MIAQPIQTTPPKAQPQASQSQPASANGFLTLLSPDNSSLLATGQGGGNILPSAVPDAANSNKPKTDGEATATPYVNAPMPPSNVPPDAGKQSSAGASNSPTLILPPSDAAQSSPNGAATASNAVLPPSASQAGASGDASSATANGTSNATGNSTGFGADVNARIAAGAPIYASQPTAAMATVPAHLLNAAAPQGQASASGKTGDAASQKADADAGTQPPAPGPAANSATPASPPHPAHVAANDQANNGGNQNPANPAPAVSADAGSSSGTNANANAASSSLVAQQNTPITTPAQIDAAVHTATPYVPVGEQVALNLKQAITADNNEIRIQLKPASLGTIDVKLSLTQDGRVSAVISADRSDTLNMLKQDSGTLQQSLRDAGLNADSSSLNFSFRGDAQSFAQNSSQGGYGRGGGGSGGNYSIGGSASVLGSTTSAATQRYHAGALDIEV